MSWAVFEGVFELASLGAVFVRGDDAFQRGCTLLPPCTLQDVKYGIEVEQAGPLRAVDHDLEVRRAEDGGEVEQRAGDARDRNAVEEREVLRVEHAGAVAADGADLAGNGRDGDFEESGARTNAP